MDAQHTTTTAPLTSMHGTARDLQELTTAHYTVQVDQDSYTVSFTDVDAALAAIEKAKAKAWATYLRGGGNPRNKRSHGSQYAAVKKAVVAAAA